MYWDGCESRFIFKCACGGDLESRGTGANVTDGRLIVCNNNNKALSLMARSEKGPGTYGRGARGWGRCLRAIGVAAVYTSYCFQ